MKLNQKGIIAQVLILLLLAVGLVVGLYLVKNPQIFQPKAKAAWLTVKDTNGTALPFNSSGVPQTQSISVILNIYSLLGTRNSVSSPSVPYDVSVKIAESPTGLDTAAAIPFNQEPVVLPFTFSDSTPGQKFVWAEFLDSLGRTDRRTATIELISSSVSEPISPTPTPTSNPISAPVTPAPTQQPVSGGGGGGGGGGGSTPAPATIRNIAQFRYAEDPSVLYKAPWQNYVPNIAVAYTFTDTTPGNKFIFVQFKDDKGEIVQISGQNYISSSIELVTEPTSTPTTAPNTPSGPAPLSSDGPNCPISNPSNYDIGTLYKMCSVDQLARFDLKWLVDFPNEVLINIGRRKGDLGGFLANFSGERLLGLPPYKSAAAFGLDILNELPAWRKQDLPGYIQDQLK